MKKMLFFLLVLIVVPVLLSAQAKKPEVLVYGDGIDAYAAAVQSAQSGLHTVWVLNSPDLRSAMALEPGHIHQHQCLDAGIWADLLAGMTGATQRNDSLSRMAKTPMNPQLLLNAMEAEMGKHSHLHLIFQREVRSAKRNKRNWQIRLTDGNNVKVRSVVDATATGKILQLAGLRDFSFHSTDTTLAAMELQDIMRTGIAVSDLNQPHAYTIPLMNLLPEGGHNLFFTKYNPTLRHLLTTTPEDLPLLAHAGQAAGAVAAYVAFFKTTTDKIEVRQVQGELLQYGARLAPYQDIRIDDPHFRAIQRVGMTNLFAPMLDHSGQYAFSPGQKVSTSEISPVLNILYSRSQVWFSDHHSEMMNLRELLELIKYIGHRGKELESQVENAWLRKFRFSGDFDLNMPVSRLQVAVLLDEYCKPFDVRVDLKGQVTR